MRSLKKNTATALLFKKRFFKKKKYFLNLNKSTASFFFFTNIKLEYVYLKIIRKNIKYIFKRSKKIFLSRAVWLNLKSNYPVSKKSKNSRMGKGKGKFLRWAIRLSSMVPFIKFFGFNLALLKRLSLKIRHLFKIKLFLASLQIKTYLWCRQSVSKSLNQSPRKQAM